MTERDEYIANLARELLGKIAQSASGRKIQVADVDTAILCATELHDKLVEKGHPRSI